MPKDTTPLATRMKQYEHELRLKVEPKELCSCQDWRQTFIHARKFSKPFDKSWIRLFQGVWLFAWQYSRLQNDISSVRWNIFDSFWSGQRKTSSWFDYNIQKIASVLSVHLATAVFNKGVAGFVRIAWFQISLSLMHGFLPCLKRMCQTILSGDETGYEILFPCLDVPCLA